MAGIETASAVRVLLATAGLTAVLTSSAAVFNAIRWAGAAYLAYLGIRIFRTRQAGQPPGSPAPGVPLTRSAREGLIAGLRNPKMVIFYLAFFPQFIHPAQAPRWARCSPSAPSSGSSGRSGISPFAFASGTVGTWLQHRPRIRAAQPRLEGLTYLALAGWAVMTGARSAAPNTPGG